MAGVNSRPSPFQSTPPRGGRPLKAVLRGLGGWFQSTPPRGGRHALAMERLDVGDRVSIHAPAWGATGRHGGDFHRHKVSIHAPAWGATGMALRVGRPPKSFNPRPRVGGDDRDHVPLAGVAVVSIHAPAWGATIQAGLREFATKVSIHAPAWGATGRRRGRGAGRGVSIHAPAWGATFGLKFDPFTELQFQSTPPRGGRLARAGRDFADRVVSIHAPAWGATRSGPGSAAMVRLGFNPRPRVGGDPCGRSRDCGRSRAFQSTPPRGGRRGTRRTTRQR